MIFIKIFLGILTCLILSWFSSFILFIKIEKITIENLIKRIVVGSLLMALLTAMIITHGHTILLISIPSLILMSIHFNKKNCLNIKEKIIKEDILAIFIFIFSATFFAFLNIRGFDLNNMKVPISDQAWYATIARGIIYYGNESYLSYLQPYYSYKTLNIPYHYFEYWLTYNIYSITHFNIHLILNGIIYGFSLFCIFLAFYSIFKLWLKNHIVLTIICSILFLALRGIIHYAPAINENFVHATDSIFFDGNQKLIYILPFFLLGFYFIFKEDEIGGLLILLLLPALNIINLPSVLGGICLFVVYNFIKSGKFYKIYFKKYNLILVAIFLIFISIYIYFKYIGLNIGNTGVVKSFGGILQNILKNGSIWLVINSILLIFLLYLLFRNVKSYGLNIFILSTCILLAGLIGYSIFDNNQNAWQMHAVSARIAVYIMFLLLLFLIKRNLNNLKIAMVFLGFLATFMFFENFSNIRYLPMLKISAYNPEYINTISKYQFRNKIGIKYINPTGKPNLQRNPIYAGICSYFVLTENAFSSVVMNIDKLLPMNNNNDSIFNFYELNNGLLSGEIIKLSPLINESKLCNQIITMKEFEMYKIKFIERWKPEFCIIEKGVNVPIYLKIKSKLIDNNTGEQFLILNN